MELHGPKVVVYPVKPALEGAKRSILHGRKTALAECQFVIRLELAPGEGRIDAREISFDPDSCDLLVETGKVQNARAIDPRVRQEPGSTWARTEWNTRLGWQRESSGWVGLIAPRSSSGQDSSGVAAQDYDSGSIAPPAFGSGVKMSTGYFHTRTNDPLNFEVNSIEATLTWLWDGGSALEDSGWIQWTALSGTGWSLYSSSSSHGTYNNHEYAYQSAYGTFKNTTFCNPVQNTWVYYQPMTIYGYRSGYLAGEVWRTKAGDCSGLLDFPDITLQRNFDGYY